MPSTKWTIDEIRTWRFRTLTSLPRLDTRSRLYQRILLMICLPESTSNRKMEVAAQTKQRCTILFPTINGHIQVHESTFQQLIVGTFRCIQSILLQVSPYAIYMLLSTFIYYTENLIISNKDSFYRINISHHYIMDLKLFRVCED
jgi:hypothetical protein